MPVSSGIAKGDCGSGRSTREGDATTVRSGVTRADQLQLPTRFPCHSVSMLIDMFPAFICILILP